MRRFHLTAGALLLCSAAMAAATDVSVPAQVNQRLFPYVSFTILSAFPYELPDPLADPADAVVGNVIPPRVKAFDRKSLTVRGFILPLDLDQKGVSQFILTASYDMCYFGAPMQMNEWVMVKMKNAQKVPFTHFPVYVSGSFEVGEEKRDGRVQSLYRMAGDSVVIQK